MTKKYIRLLMVAMLCAAGLDGRYSPRQGTANQQLNGQLTRAALGNSTSRTPSNPYSDNFSDTSSDAGSDSYYDTGSFDVSADAAITSKATQMINNAFQSMDLLIGGGSSDWHTNKVTSRVQLATNALNKSFDTLAASMNASTQSMQPIKDAFSQAITFFGTRSPNNMDAWLPKIVDAAKLIVTAPAKIAVRIAATAAGTAVGAVHGALDGVVTAVLNPVGHYLNIESALSYQYNNKVDSMTDILLHVAIGITTRIAIAVQGVVEAPIIVAYKTVSGAYVGARAGNDVAREKITGNVLKLKSPIDNSPYPPISGYDNQPDFEVDGTEYDQEINFGNVDPSKAMDDYYNLSSREGISHDKAASLAYKNSEYTGSSLGIKPIISASFDNTNSLSMSTVSSQDSDGWQILSQPSSPAKSKSSIATSVSTAQSFQPAGNEIGALVAQRNAKAETTRENAAEKARENAAIEQQERRV